MAFNKKLTLKHGADQPTVAISAGTDVAAMTDGVEVNIEQLTMTKQECLDALGRICRVIQAGPWPIA